MASNKEHGDRNLALAEILRNGLVYYDWCVTTAYYSSIQHFEGVLFPVKLNDQLCKNIGEARKALDYRGKHETRQQLVYKRFGRTIAMKYEWLENRSRVARYSTFKPEFD